MKLIFRIDYRTNWGESLYVSANIPALGGGEHAKALKMEIDGDRAWHAELELPDGIQAFRYQYIVRNDSGDVKHEWGDSHLFEPVAGVHEYELYDQRHEMPYDKPFYSRAFTECIFRHDENKCAHVLPGAGTLVFHVTAPTVPSDCALAICGDADILGKWNPAQALRLSCNDFPVWKIAVPSACLTADTEYKFLIIKADDGSVVRREERSQPPPRS